MQINSISSTSISSYKKTTALSDKEIAEQLQALGLESTGSRAGDLAAIQAATSSSSSQQVDSTQSSSSSNSSSFGGNSQPPWANLMDKLGLQLTGTPEGDYQAASEKLKTLEVQATTETKKAEVQSLYAEFSTAFSNSNASSAVSSTSNSSSDQTTSAAASEFVGQTQLAMMNKMFLVKNSQSA